MGAVRVLEVDNSGPDFFVLRRRFLGEDANAVRGEDGAPQRLEGVARLLHAVEYARVRIVSSGNFTKCVRRVTASGGRSEN